LRLRNVIKIISHFGQHGENALGKYLQQDRCE
jgi:hypothetical protein